MGATAEGTLEEKRRAAAKPFLLTHDHGPAAAAAIVVAAAEKNRGLLAQIKPELVLLSPADEARTFSLSLSSFPSFLYTVTGRYMR